MRLICPNCAAQYEIEESLIPPDGRDVQCSNCGHTWFQAQDPDAGAFTDADADDAAPHVAAVGAAEDGPRSGRRELDERTRAILREEAEREAEKRRAARGAPPPAERENPGLDDLPDRPRSEVADTAPDALEAAPHSGPDIVPDDTVPGDAAPNDAATTPPQPAAPTRPRPASPEAAREAAALAASSRGDLLPDIDQINSTLTATSERQASLRDVEIRETHPPIRTNGARGFRLGFSAVLFATALAIALYLAAPRLAATFPVTESGLANYVQSVNGLRAWLDDGLVAASRAIEGLIGVGETG